MTPGRHCDGPEDVRSPMYDSVALAPLEDPKYVPAHPPVNGVPPDVVEKWGARSQLRWFNRFRDQLTVRLITVWDRFYCASTEHRGMCCTSCKADWWDFGPIYTPDDTCCCKGLP